jgi:hypothetical protein
MPHKLAAPPPTWAPPGGNPAATPAGGGVAQPAAGGGIAEPASARGQPGHVPRRAPGDGPARAVPTTAALQKLHASQAPSGFSQVQDSSPATGRPQADVPARVAQPAAQPRPRDPPQPAAQSESVEQCAGAAASGAFQDALHAGETSVQASRRASFAAQDAALQRGGSASEAERMGRQEARKLFVAHTNLKRGTTGAGRRVPSI